VKTIE
jgi:hypothetical protein